MKKSVPYRSRLAIDCKYKYLKKSLSIIFKFCKKSVKENLSSSTICIVFLQSYLLKSILNKLLVTSLIMNSKSIISTMAQEMVGRLKSSSKECFLRDVLWSSYKQLKVRYAEDLQARAGMVVTFMWKTRKLLFSIWRNIGFPRHKNVLCMLISKDLVSAIIF
jgi:hypothetical protein